MRFPPPVPVWNAQHSRANWDRKKNLFAKLTKSTGVGQALENVTRASAPVRRDMDAHYPPDAGQATAAQIGEITQQVALYQTLQQAVQALVNCIGPAISECRASKFVSHEAADFLIPIQTEANHMLNYVKNTVTFWKAYLAEHKTKAAHPVAT